mmetsp:Transcript_3092/g.4480  ORF Transcript_3092/g.4480 Transcript_3092/m.4480 type:complete len:112 (+) Transcript_3092:2078-2413(+)
MICGLYGSFPRALKNASLKNGYVEELILSKLCMCIPKNELFDMFFIWNAIQITKHITHQLLTLLQPNHGKRASCTVHNYANFFLIGLPRQHNDRSLRWRLHIQTFSRQLYQ